VVNFWDKEVIVNYHYSYNSFKKSLKVVGVKKSDTIFIHSNIGFFGNCKKSLKYASACETIYNAIFDVLGKSGTLIVPTFTYSFLVIDR